MSNEKNQEVRELPTKASFDLTTRAGRIKLHNAKSVAGVGLKDVKDKVLEIEGVAVYPQMTDENGLVLATALFGTDGVVYSGISASVAENAEDLIDNYDLFAEDGIMKVKVVAGESNSGRTYLTLGIVE